MLKEAEEILYKLGGSQRKNAWKQFLLLVPEMPVPDKEPFEHNTRGRGHSKVV